MHRFTLSQIDLAIECCKNFNLAMVEAYEHDSEVNYGRVELICVDKNYAEFLCSHPMLGELGAISITYRILTDDDIECYHQLQANPIKW